MVRTSFEVVMKAQVKFLTVTIQLRPQQTIVEHTFKEIRLPRSSWPYTKEVSWFTAAIPFSSSCASLSLLKRLALEFLAP